MAPFNSRPGSAHARFKVHRAIGKIYVIACLTAGLVLALHSSAGPIAQWGFGTLAPVWFAATAYAFWLATQGRIAEHRCWMIRSFAMTFAAVTLRLYLPIPPVFLHMSFIDGYRAISWFCWTSNLVVAELLLNRAVLRGLLSGRDKALPFARP